MLNLQEKIRNASFIAAVSDAGHRQLSEQHKDFVAKIQLIRCGLDARWFDVAAPMTQPGAELVCIARLEPQKDPFLLLTAVEALAARGVSFQLKFAGDGSLRKAMETHIAENALGRYIVLLGWQTEGQIVEHLRGARALVLSSRSEGLPVAIMEAFALGVPAIAPDVGGVNELVVAGATGWLVPGGDAKALADAIHECLLAPPEELWRLGTEARRRIQSYDIRVSVDHLIKEFLKSIKSPVSRPASGEV
jgi:glycosyltransferase involved in cell wall biosynthesis